MKLGWLPTHQSLLEMMCYSYSQKSDEGAWRWKDTNNGKCHSFQHKMLLNHSSKACPLPLPISFDKCHTSGCWADHSYKSGTRQAYRCINSIPRISGNSPNRTDCRHCYHLASRKGNQYASSRRTKNQPKESMVNRIFSREFYLNRCRKLSI